VATALLAPPNPFGGKWMSDVLGQVEAGTTAAGFDLHTDGVPGTEYDVGLVLQIIRADDGELHYVLTVEWALRTPPEFVTSEGDLHRLGPSLQEILEDLRGTDP
jgi:hypothetical protein